jgi:GDPmannose 4,6-dehydratase
MKVLIIGISGQTAAYTTKILINNGHDITGSTRDKSQVRLRNLYRLNIDINNLNIISLDPADARQVFTLLASLRFDVIINLAGQTSVSLSFDQPAQALESISTSCLNFIEAIKAFNLNTKYFNAASSECFGNTGCTPADEDTPFRPNSPYAVAKSTAYQLTRLGREAYGLKVFSGIFSNHESPLRPAQFVTQKIITGLLDIKKAKSDHLVLGNLNTTRDWGFAPDYAEAVVKMVESDIYEDYVIATGESHSLREFIDVAANIIGLDSGVHVIQDPSLIRPLDVDVCRLSVDKINKNLGWKSSVGFNSLIEKLVHGFLY